MKRLLLFCAISLLTLTSFGQENTYYIGHSGFGWDLIVGEMVNDLAIDAGITTYGYNFQFIGGTCVANQWINHASPQGGTDSWMELPSGNYDIMVLAEQIPIQEVIDGSSFCNPTIISSVSAVDNFYDMAIAANPNTRVYLMEFHNEVDQTAATPHADWVNMNITMRPLWERVADSTTLINSGPPVCIVPVAAAYQALADSIIAGVYPGTTNWIDMFDPTDTIVATIHPTETTYYLSACVHFSTIFGQSPVGLTNQTFAAAGWQYDEPTPAQALMMQQIAWEIVSNDPRSCAPIATSINHNMNNNGSISIINKENEIEINLKENSFSNIELYNTSGQIVLNTNIHQQKFSLDTRQLTAGIYVVRLIGEQSFMKKIVINN